MGLVAMKQHTLSRRALAPAPAHVETTYQMARDALKEGDSNHRPTRHLSAAAHRR